MKLTSPAFGHNTMIPKKYTCEGQDISPPLEIQGVPEGTKTLALIVDDPDAPMGTWVHWVLYDLPAETHQLPEGVPKDEQLTSGARQGRNDFRRIGYGGPCPPPGPAHRYFFKLYALDTALGLASGADKSQLLQAMPNIKLVEMEHSREKALCCGATSWLQCGAVNRQIQKERLAQVEASRAEILVTACPKCQLHLRCAQKSSDGNDARVEIQDLASLVAQSLD